MSSTFGLLIAFLGCITSITATPTAISRQDSVHLAISPTCGTLSSSPASVNAGLNDLTSYKTIIAFGGSYTSGGLSNGSALSPAILTPPSPLAGGRLSNGELWIENLATAAGATLHDYAVNGSVIDAPEYDPTSLLRQANDYMSQVEIYLTRDRPQSDPDTTLYAIFVGMEDYENQDELYFKNFSLTAGAVSYSIGELISGSNLSKHFLVIDNYGRGTKSTAGEQYKQALFSDLIAAKDQWGISFAFVDLYPLWDGVLTDPEAFGYTSTGACTVNDLTTEGACNDPDHTFYWIPGNPSAATHSIIADYVQEVLTSCQA